MGVWIIVAVIIVINLLGFVTMGFDKRQAQRHQWRVPEFRLFAIAFFGGGLGAYWGMKHFRHKTQHTSFRVLFPIAALWCLIAYYFVLKAVLVHH